MGETRKALHSSRFTQGTHLFFTLRSEYLIHLRYSRAQTHTPALASSMDIDVHFYINWIERGPRARVKTQNQQNSSGPPSTARLVQPSEMYRMGSNIEHTHARKTHGGTLWIQTRHLAE